jgi:hypothetical protein
MAASGCEPQAVTRDSAWLPRLSEASIRFDLSHVGGPWTARPSGVPQLTAKAIGDRSRPEAFPFAGGPPDDVCGRDLGVAVRIGQAR